MGKETNPKTSLGKKSSQKPLPNDDINSDNSENYTSFEDVNNNYNLHEDEDINKIFTFFKAEGYVLNDKNNPNDKITFVSGVCRKIMSYPQYKGKFSFNKIRDFYRNNYQGRKQAIKEYNIKKK